MIGKQVKVKASDPNRPGFVGKVTSRCPGERWHIQVMSVDYTRPKTGNLAVGIILKSDEFDVLAA